MPLNLGKNHSYEYTVAKAVADSALILNL